CANGSALLSGRMEPYSEGAETTWLGAGGSRLPARDLDALLAESVFRMDGARAYRIAAAHVEAFLEKLLNEAHASLDDIACVAPHQASGHALALMKTRLGLNDGRVVEILRECGNQVATSMPSALAYAIEQGRVVRGDKVLLLGTGAGVSLGGAVMVY
ncbi:MAG: 3-oxoacyl-[acyl-carrier-protein] synthase III C-terminal domain-containing protein, partial [Hyphomonadaceae bacterium]